MHILIVPSAYPTEDSPLRSIFFKEQAIALKEQGIDVGVIYNETRRVTGINLKTLKKFYFQVSENNEDGINTIRLHGWSLLTMRKSVGINLWVKQSIKLFERYIKKYGKPDIIHVHIGLYGGLIGKAIKEKYDIPYIITEHSSVVMNHGLNNYNQKVLREVYDSADKLISVGNKLKESMTKYTKSDILVVPNIVDTKEFKFTEIKKEKFTFISISLLKKSKNVDITLKAFANLIKRRNDLELVIIGDGPEKEKLLELSKSLNIEEYVQFKGAVNRENLYSYLKEASVFVLPSEFETFGVVYIEALASGLPIITTKCGGPEDFYSEKLGVIIDKPDVDDLEKAMNKIINKYNSYDLKEISDSIKYRFDKKVIAEKIIEIYKRIK